MTATITPTQSQQHDILVVRQESLKRDLQQLEEYLAITTGAKQAHPELSLYSNDNIHYITDKVSIPTARLLQSNKLLRQQLCCLLFSENYEYAIYMTLIQQSINLSAEEKIQTYIQSLQICGVDVDDHDTTTNNNNNNKYRRMMIENTRIQDWKQQSFDKEICQPLQEKGES
jgi:hypothetical protein